MSLLRYVYDEDFLMETFGTLEPTVSERTEKFYQMWCDWHLYSMPLDGGYPVIHIKRILTGLGFKEFRDYQIKFTEIRFKDQTTQSMAVMALGDYCV